MFTREQPDDERETGECSPISQRLSGTHRARRSCVNWECAKKQPLTCGFLERATVIETA
jgi:hypothetical protein